MELEQFSRGGSAALNTRHGKRSFQQNMYYDEDDEYELDPITDTYTSKKPNKYGARTSFSEEDIKVFEKVMRLTEATLSQFVKFLIKPVYKALQSGSVPRDLQTTIPNALRAGYNGLINDISFPNNIGIDINTNLTAKKDSNYIANLIFYTIIQSSNVAGLKPSDALALFQKKPSIVTGIGKLIVGCLEADKFRIANKTLSEPQMKLEIQKIFQNATYTQVINLANVLPGTTR